MKQSKAKKKISLISSALIMGVSLVFCFIFIDFENSSLSFFSSSEINFNQFDQNQVISREGFPKNNQTSDRNTSLKDHLHSNPSRLPAAEPSHTELRSVKKYKKVVNLPPNFIPLGKRDPLTDKYSPRTKTALGEDESLSLNLLPSHYFLNLERNKEETYRVSLKAQYKGRSVDVLLGVHDQLDKSYPIRKVGPGLYEMTLNSNELTPGKKYFEFQARYKNSEVWSRLSLEVNQSLVRHLRPIDQGLNAQGNLFFNHEFLFHQEGTYLIEGILYHENSPIAQVSKVLKNVPQGPSQLNLQFHGYFFSQKKISGHFQLKSLQVRRVDDSLKTFGNQWIELNSETSYLSWQQFNSRAYENEIIRNKIERLTQR